MAVLETNFSPQDAELDRLFTLNDLRDLPRLADINLPSAASIGRLMLPA